MTAYAYRAADRGGATRKGIIEASSPAAARAMLRDQSLLPLSVEVAGEKRASLGTLRLPSLRRRGITPRQLATITRQISTLVGSDVSIEESLRLVAGQAEQAAVSALLLDVDRRSSTAAASPQLSRSTRALFPVSTPPRLRPANSPDG